MVCKKCEMQNPEGSLFCKYCGERIPSAKPQAENTAEGPVATGVAAPEKEKKGLFGRLGRK